QVAVDQGVTGRGGDDPGLEGLPAVEEVAREIGADPGLGGIEEVVRSLEPEAALREGRVIEVDPHQRAVERAPVVAAHVLRGEGVRDQHRIRLGVLADPEQRL
ncbi:MAG: hypothetical protein ACK55I_09635, partial [bacterium]